MNMDVNLSYLNECKFIHTEGLKISTEVQSLLPIYPSGVKKYDRNSEGEGSL